MMDFAWIICAKTELVAEISAYLRHAFPKTRSVAFSPRQAITGLPKRQAARFIVVDLRDDASFAFLKSIYDKLCRSAPTARLIGITGDSIPVAHLVTAAHLLDALVSESQLAARLPAALNGAVASADIPARPLSLAEAETTRELRGTQRTFRTYETSLFPLLERLHMVANRDVTSLLIGETGTGKTTLARILHELSSRSRAEFVHVACGTLSENLVASELFGHRRGAFTSADRDRTGKFEVAAGGTLLLDEIDVLNMENQAKLLRVLESGEFEPLGTHEVRKSTARVVVASNVCLDTLMAERRFRPDLYFRLHQTKFELPPLRRRRRDLAPLLADVLDEFCRLENICVSRLAVDVVNLVHSYRWPGNIREFRNELHNAVLFARNETLTLDGFSANLLLPIAASVRGPIKAGLAEDVAVAERGAIELMLRKHNFNRSAAARELGISRVTLYSKLRKYDIDLDC